MVVVSICSQKSTKTLSEKEHHLQSGETATVIFHARQCGETTSLAASHHVGSTVFGFWRCVPPAMSDSESWVSGTNSLFIGPHCPPCITTSQHTRSAKSRATESPPPPFIQILDMLVQADPASRFSLHFPSL